MACYLSSKCAQDKQAIRVSSPASHPGGSFSSCFQIKIARDKEKKAQLGRSTRLQVEAKQKLSGKG
jgi:hypothetical protein